MIRPYLKCALKFDWHIKPAEVANPFLDTLAKFLLEKDFRRPERIGVRCGKRLTQEKGRESNGPEETSSSSKCVRQKRSCDGKEVDSSVVESETGRKVTVFRPFSERHN